MAIAYKIDTHAVAGASKLLATNGGKHIYNIKLTSDTDNGSIIGKGDYLAFDLYGEGTATNFAGVIRDKAANGNWYIEVTEAENALLVYQVPLIYEEYSNKFTKESNFYNLAGDVVRSYELAVGDIFELSAEGIDAGETTDLKGKTVNVTGRKVTVAE